MLGVGAFLQDVTWSGISGLLYPDRPMASDHVLGSFPCRFSTKAPFLSKHYSASTVLRAYPPLCEPGLPHARSRLACAPLTGFPVLPRFPSSMHADTNTPANTVRCPRCSFPGRLAASPYTRRVGTRVEVFGACPVFTRVSVESRSDADPVGRFHSLLVKPDVRI